ncbi:Ig-like domain-containing protein [Brucella intermedia]|uniref:Ig-like domain-containing protein n=1 Tax=Brucella intermedia TaxID=94625 RepID=UPI00124D90B3|nr:Ig-like domain-containing protein [Brucella intermedia]KAB2723295.1 BapA prefix-like domain-containing protein [Brucella intermedia]
MKMSTEKNTIDQISVVPGAKVSARAGKSSAFVIEADRDGVSNYAREKNDLVVEFKDGRSLRIKSFFADKANLNQLVFVDDGARWLVRFDQALSADGDGIIDPLVVYEKLGEDNSVAALLAILGAAAGGGALAAAAGGGDGDGGSKMAPAPKPAVPSIGMVLDNQGAIQGPVENGDVTDDATPTLSGEGDPGSTITIYDNGKKIGLTIVDENGNWTWTPETPLTEGEHVLTTTATNKDGDESAPSDSHVIVVDTIAPAKPGIGDVTDNVGEIQGSIPDGGFTDDARPTLSGKDGEPGSTIVIYDNGVVIGSVVVGPDGSWCYTPDVDLGDGRHELTATATDKAGNISTPSDPYVITVDTVPPMADNAVAIIGFEDNVGIVVGTFGSGASTDDTSPLLKGTVSGLQAGEEVHVYDASGRFVGKATVSGGNWSYQLEGLGEGDHGYKAVIVDAAGNRGTESAEFKLTVDTTAPIGLDEGKMDLWDDVGDIQGSIPNSADSLTDDNKPTYSGEADPASVKYVEIFDNGKLIGRAEVGADGKWSFEPSTALAAGPHSFTAVPVDAAGNRGPATSAWEFKMAGPAPSAPAITLVQDDDDAGNILRIEKGASTNDTTPVISGTATPGTKVTVFVDGAEAGTADVDTDGRWTITIDPPLSGDGEKKITAQSSDGAGQKSPMTGDYPIVLDTTAPAKPVFEAHDDEGQKVGLIVNGDVTDDNLPLFSGRGEPGEKVTVYNGTEELGTATVGSDGTWKLQLTKPLAEHVEHSITVTLTDAAGNVSEPSDALKFEIDRSDVTVSITRAVDDHGPVKGDLGNGDVTDDVSPVLVGTATPKSEVTIYEGGVALGTVTADENGNWQFALSDVSEGMHTYTAVAKNAAGTEGSAKFSLEVDITAPDVPSIGEVLDDVGLVQGPVGNGKPTDDTTPTLKGSGATPGDTITIYDGEDTVLGKVVVDGNGEWTFTPDTELSTGPHDLTVTATDKAGNESARSESHTIIVDTEAPSATAKLSGITDDTGASDSDFVTGDTTLKFGIEVEGTLEAGDRVQVSLDGGKTWVDATFVGGNRWEMDNTGTELGEGTHVVQTRVIDEAGNPGAASSQNVVIDTTAPIGGSYAVAITGFEDDAGSVTGMFGSGASTDDTSPLLKGTVSGLQAGEEVHVYDASGRFVGKATVSGGNWSYQLEGLGEGDHGYKAVIVDAAGNRGTESAEFKLTVDTTAPIGLDEGKMDLWDDVGDIQGSIPNSADSLTDDNKPTYSGEADPASVKYVEIFDNGKLIGRAEVGADGKWSFEPSTALAAGPHSFTAVPVDAAGNRGPATSAWEFKMAGPAPSAPAITLVQDDDDAGNILRIEKGASTNDTTPVISGTATPGTKVTVFVDGAEAGTADVDTDGRWTITIDPPLSGDGEKKITAQSSDGAGQKSPMTGDYPIVLDTTAPAKPVFEAHDDEGQKVGLIVNGDVTDDNLPLFSGRGEPGEKVTVYNGTEELGTATVGSDGTWKLQLTKPLAEHVEHSITVTLTDAAGNVSEPSDALKFEIDRSDVTVSITRAVDDHGPVKGDLGNGDVTDDVSPVLVGTATPKSEVTIYEGGVSLGTVTADENGNWQFALSDVSEGMHTYTAVAKNAAGTEGSAKFSLEVDITAPDVPSIGEVLDDVGLVQGPVGNGKPTDDTTPTLKGSGATPGDTITIYDGEDTVLGKVVVDGNGEWTFTPDTELSTGPHDLTVTATDKAGNESARSESHTIIVDTEAPSATAKLSGITDDTGASDSDFVTGDTTLKFGIEVEGTLEAGDRVQVSLDGGKTWVDATFVGGNRWEMDNTGTELGEGTHVVQTRVIDEAGNPGAASSQNVVIDTTAPDASVTFDGYYDDKGAVTGDFGFDKPTDDDTPLLKGGLSKELAGGEQVAIYRDGEFIGYADVDGTNWAFADSGLTEERGYRYEARIVDAAGNSGSIAETVLNRESMLTLEANDTVVHEAALKGGTGKDWTDGGQTDTDDLTAGGVFNLGSNVTEITVSLGGEDRTLTLAELNANPTLALGGDKLSITSLGNGQYSYSYTLQTPKTHDTSGGGVGETVQNDLTIVARDNSGNTTSATGRITVVNDELQATPGDLVINSGTVSTAGVHITIVYDSSFATTQYSATDNGTRTLYWEFQLQAIKSMAAKYQEIYPEGTEFVFDLINVGGVKTTVTANSALGQSVWQRLEATLNALQAGTTGVNWNGALAQAQNAIVKSMTDHSMEWDEKLYFITVGSHLPKTGIPDSWKDFINGYRDNIDAYSLSYGKGVVEAVGGDISALYKNTEDLVSDPTKAFVMEDPLTLSSVLSNTVEVAGNLFLEGQSIVSGGDGGFVLEKVLIAGKEYVLSPDHGVVIDLGGGYSMTLDSHGRYTLSKPTTANELEFDITFVVSDADGDIVTVTKQMVLGDQTQPVAAPNIVQFLDNVGMNQGWFGNGTNTDDTQIWLHGDGAVAGGRVLIYDNGKFLGEATIVNGNQWILNLEELGLSLDEGQHVFTARNVGIDGTESGQSNNFVVNVGEDTIPPSTGTPPSVGNGPAKDYAGLGWDISSAGDFNGDGIEDFLVSAPALQVGNQIVKGSNVYLVYGTTNGLPDFANGIDRMTAAQGIKLDGSALSGGDKSDTGIRVRGIGDFNGDGYDDIVLASHMEDAGHVIFGRGDKPGTIQLNGTGAGYGFRLSGGAWAATDAAGVDINGDGYADLVISSSSIDRAYVLYGSADAKTFYSGKNISLTDAGITKADKYSILTGAGRAQTAAAFGDHINSVGDVNGDGYEDFIVTDPRTTDHYGNSNGGMAYLVFGQATGLPGNLDVNSASFSGVKLGGTQVGENLGDVIIYPENNAHGDMYYGSGNTISTLGDINGDGIDDFIIGSPLWGDNASDGFAPGRAYVVYGKAQGQKWSDLSLDQLNGSNGFVLTANNMGDALLGHGVRGGFDFNGDGLDDFLIGASNASTDGKSMNGATYLVFGQAGGFNANVNLDSLVAAGKAMKWTGGSTEDFMGTGPGMGDWNGDGIGDIAIGSWEADTNGKTNNGSYQVIYGQPTDLTHGFSAGDDVIAARTGIADRISGGAGNDTITSVGKDDVVYGGAGNDRVVLESTDFLRVDGGYGVDTLVLGGSGQTLVLDGRVKGFEKFDVGTAGNVIQVRSSDIARLGDFNLVRNSGKVQLVIDGGSGSSVLLPKMSAVEMWMSSGTVSYGGKSYNVYTDLLGKVEVYVGQGLTVQMNTTPLVATQAEDVAIAGSSEDLTAGDFLHEGIVIDGRDAIVMAGSAGDDTITVSGTHFMSVDGGAGVDTLVWDTAEDLNFSDIAGKVSGIEVIDLGNEYANTLTLTLEDVLGASETTDTLFVRGGEDDNVVLDEGWELVGSEEWQGETYAVYANEHNAGASLWVQSGVGVTVGSETPWTELDDGQLLSGSVDLGNLLESPAADEATAETGAMQPETGVDRDTSLMEAIEFVSTDISSFVNFDQEHQQVVV